MTRVSSKTLRAIGRARRTMIHAAELLEADAQALKESHTLDGRWGSSRMDHVAKYDYNDMITTAQRLRTLAGEH